MKRSRRKTKIEGQFSWRLAEMIEHPVLRVLNQSEHRALLRLEAELARHGGTSNGKLVVTHKQFQEFGVDREAVSPSIRCLVALKIVEITKQGRGGNREYREASEFRLTFRHTDKANPTDDWRRITSMEEARSLAVDARKAKDADAVARSSAAAKKQKTGSESPRISGRKLRPENKKHRVGNSDVVVRVGDSDVASISRGGTEQPPREARPLKGAVASEAAGHGEPIRLDLLHARLAERFGWDVVTAMSDTDIAHAAALEHAGALDEVAVRQIRLRNKLAGAGGTK